jgi:hypothetical protein
MSSDPFGLRPLFRNAADATAPIASSLADLLDQGAPADLDPAAMAVFLRTGFFVGDDTPFAAIRAVAPPVTERRRTALAISRAAAEDAFGDLFSAAIQRALRCTEAPTAVPLSGGHDSRHILFALLEARQRPACCVTVYPYAAADDDDLAIAHRVAEAVSVRHVLIPQRTDRVDVEREKNVLTHYCAEDHAQFLPLRPYFEEVHRHVFDGLGGDVLAQSRRLNPTLHVLFDAGRFEAVANHILGDEGAIEPALEHVLSVGALAMFPRDLAVSRIAEEAARHADAPNPIASFYFFTQVRREIALAPYALYGGTDVSTPFTDPDVAEFLLALPYGVVADRQFHTSVLCRRYPRYAGIPFAARHGGPTHWATGRRDAAQLLTFVTRSRSALVNLPAIAARCLRTIANGETTQLGFLPRVVHLLQVEHLAGTPAARVPEAVLNGERVTAARATRSRPARAARSLAADRA